MVAIVGSRNYQDLDGVRSYVRDLDRQLIGKRLDLVVLSGGAKGVDQISVDEARRIGAGYEVLRPDISDGKPFWIAAFARDDEVVQRCHHLVAFWDGYSNGTAHTIERARDAGKLRRVFNEDEA